MWAAQFIKTPNSVLARSINPKRRRRMNMWKKNFVETMFFYNLKANKLESKLENKQIPSVKVLLIWAAQFIETPSPVQIRSIDPKRQHRSNMWKKNFVEAMISYNLIANKLEWGLDNQSNRWVKVTWMGGGATRPSFASSVKICLQMQRFDLGFPFFFFRAGCCF